VWPDRSPAPSNRCWNSRASGSTLPDSATRQFRTSPAAGIPYERRSSPELPPSSDVATTAVTSSGWTPSRAPAARESPASTSGSPVPPPTATARNGVRSAGELRLSICQTSSGAPIGAPPSRQRPFAAHQPHEPDARGRARSRVLRRPLRSPGTVGAGRSQSAHDGSARVGRRSFHLPYVPVARITDRSRRSEAAHRRRSAVWRSATGRLRASERCRNMTERSPA
jgi:hypothetical protein